MTTAGAGAAAGALTGFVSSSVGAAAVIGGFGAGGAHAVGSRMARRLGESLPSRCVAPGTCRNPKFLCCLRMHTRLLHHML